MAVQKILLGNIAGPQGIQGPVGPQGPQGIQGPAGVDGVDGATGPQGERGPQGDKGDTGPVGPTGATGPQGETGATGPEGPQGAKGDTGQRGSRWVTGTSITGKDTTPQTYATGITDALANDIYINVNTNNYYRCLTGGDETTATWQYVGSFGSDAKTLGGNPVEYFAVAVHEHTKADVGLDNVDNTADADKSVKYAASAGSATTAETCTGNAASASSVAWDNVSGKPSSMPASDVSSWAKASSKPSYSWNEITSKPTSMPASDVYSWAKASSKPSYTKAEVGLGNVDNTADSAKSVSYANSAGYAASAGSAPANGGTATWAGYTSNADPSAATIKNIYAGTSAMTSGSTSLATGTIYVQYE